MTKVNLHRLMDVEQYDSLSTPDFVLKYTFFEKPSRLVPPQPRYLPRQAR